MPRPKTDPYWVQQLWTLAADGCKPAKISRELARIARQEGSEGCPSYTTVRRLYEDWERQPEAARRLQAHFHWPASMQEGTLPWEAGRAALDLLRYRDERGLERPTVSEARWFWRLRLAAPTLPDEDADHFARQLALSQYLRVAKLGETACADLEWRLAYQPWTDDTRAGSYQNAAERHGLPPYPTSIFMGRLGDERGVRAHAQYLLGTEAVDTLMVEYQRMAAAVEALGQESQ